MKIPFLILNGILCIILISCSRNNTAIFNPDATEITGENTPSQLKYTSWVDSIHKQPWQWMYGKYSTNYTDGNRSFGFKTSIKCRKDSALNALISVASIPIFNSLASPDSVYYINKKDRCFGKQPISFFESLLGVELSMQNIQELFLGLPLGFKDSMKYVSKFNVKGDSIYVSATLNGVKPITCHYGSSVKSPRLTWQRIFSLEDSTELNIQYDQWGKHGLMDIPSLIDVYITSKKQNIHVILTYERFELNSPQDIYLQIPDDYAPCK